MAVRFVSVYYDLGGACDSDAIGFAGHVSRVGSQQKLGLWAERRAGIGGARVDHPVAVRAILIPSAE